MDRLHNMAESRNLKIVINGSILNKKYFVYVQMWLQCSFFFFNRTAQDRTGRDEVISGDDHVTWHLDVISRDVTGRDNRLDIAVTSSSDVIMVLTWLVLQDRTVCWVYDELKESWLDDVSSGEKTSDKTFVNRKK